MAQHRLLQRGAALGLLLALLGATAATAWDWSESYSDGQREIADKSDQLQNLRDLAEARANFARLTGKSGKGALILAADSNPQGELAAAINQAVQGQEVVLDGLDALPGDIALTTAAVRLRGTQHGLHGFLRAIEEHTPYLTIPRFDVTLFRPADVARGKPLVLSADIRIAAVTAPAVTPPPARAPDGP